MKENILNSAIMKQVLKDSFGGIVYNVSNGGKYDATELLEIWDNLSNNEKDAMGGIILGAINFLKEYSQERGKN